jgi:TonB-linked SusC/RagA family outer membrane protein
MKKLKNKNVFDRFLNRSPVIKSKQILLFLLIFSGLLVTNGFALPVPNKVFQQSQILVSGTVTDVNGFALPSVTVQEKGTNNGVLTDFDGNFTIEVGSTESILEFNYVGMKLHSRVVGGNTSMNVQMEEDSQSLDEVIVVGYGTQKQSDLTGSVVRVSMDDKSSQANTTLFQALSGAAAGVNIQSAGMAGGEANLSIRGQTSLSASDSPLVVLDGIIYNGSIADINTNDVESIDILKDASAAAVYGSRSANGVILITTKMGKLGKPVVSFNMYRGLQDMTNNPMKVMNAEQYAVRLVDYYYQQDLYQWYYTNPTSSEGKPARPDVSNREIVAERLRTQEERDNYLAGNDIDWVDEVTQLGTIENYSMSISQRTEKSNYFVSGSYTNEEGIVLNDNFKRLTVRANLESEITDWLTFGLNTSYSYRDYSGLESSLWFARRGSPLANNKIGSSDYDRFLTGEGYMEYPLNNLYVDNSDIRNNLFLVGRAKITVPWVEGLNYELNYSNTYSNRNNNTFYPVNTPEGGVNNALAIKNPFEERDWIVNNIVSYARTFGDHDLNATLLYSREGRKANSSTLTSEGIGNPVLGYNNMGLGTLFDLASTAWEENSISYMARAFYTFKERYLLTATVRKDGFSGFAADKKFATFPSLSLGWLISDEEFFGNNSTFLKLRASYGKNGNQGIGRYSSFSRMASQPYVYGSTTAIGIYPDILGNANLGWETTTSFNVGIDYGFSNRRIYGSIDAYQAETTNVLVNRALPPASGYVDVWENIGSIDNKGVEVQLTSVNFEGEFQWETNFVFSLNRNKITKLYGGETDQDIGNSWFVGESISTIYDYESAGGVYTEQDLYSGNILDNWYPGQFKYVDQNGDGVIEPNADRTIIGYTDPNYRFSINNTLSYNNFTFSVFLNSIQGGNGYYMMDNASVTNVAWNADDVYRINASAVRPYWTPDNGVNNATGVYNTPVQHGGVYESRSFVRLQDISLSYRFEPGLLEKLKIKSLQIHVSGKNLYTWTNWSGWDPETAVLDPISNNMPLMRNITTGLSLTF